MTEARYCRARVEVSLELYVTCFVEGRGHSVGPTHDDPGDSEAEITSLHIEKAELEGQDISSYSLSELLRKILRSKDGFINDAEEALIADLNKPLQAQED